jgi:4-diphosphocytidyl-2-C-methyl-D-erythritol kinase
VSEDGPARGAPAARPVSGTSGAGSAEVLVAPAKLTVSLRVLGPRADGYHEIEAEMVALDLHDVLEVVRGGAGIEIVAKGGTRVEAVPAGADNIVQRALDAVGARASVRIEKAIPVGGGLGGGSADAAAILRWAGVDDPALAAGLGADVPFCLRGGRALVGGVGERVTRLPFEARSAVLLLPPFPMDTARVYAAWDELDADRSARLRARATSVAAAAMTRNDLAPAALRVDPRLRRWGALLGDTTGRDPMLAGSGSTWWVEGTADALGLAGRDSIELDGESGRLVAAETVPEGWSGVPVSGGRREG